MTRSVPGTSSAGARALRAVARHIIHLAVPARAEPVEQPRLRVAELAVRRCRPRRSRARAPQCLMRRASAPVSPIAVTSSRITLRRIRIVSARSTSVPTTLSRRRSRHARARAPRSPRPARRPGRLPARRAGAGKTTLARGVLRAWATTGAVKSPTYTLVELYKLSRLYLYHFDFYRFQDPQRMDDAGFRECFNGRACAWSNGRRRRRAAAARRPDSSTCDSDWRRDATARARLRDGGWQSVV